jgi:hypothetical protein
VLYRRNGNDWTRSIYAVDLVDQLQAGQLAADSVTAGTIAAAAIRAVDAAFDAAAIKNADIDTVSAQRLVVGNANITDLSATKLTAGTIDASVITVINLNASNVNSGSFTGRTLTLNLNNTVTTLANTLDGTYSQYVGLSVLDSLTSRGVKLFSTGLAFESSGTAYAYLNNAGGLGGGLNLSNGSHSINLTSSNPRIVLSHSSGSEIRLNLSGGTPQLTFNGVQVLTTRQAAITSPSGGATIDTQARTAIDAIRVALQNMGITS